MVIISPILERDETHGDTLHNTAGKLSRPTNFIECGHQMSAELLLVL